MKRTQKNLLSSISFFSLVLLSTGCSVRDAEGNYQSAYSYYPYQHYSHTQNLHSNERRLPYYVNNINNNIEKTARSLLGTDYQYGANGPYHYDCSSFTKYVFSRQGINIPRISRDQARIGQFIRAENLQKGDLIFFDSKRSSKISHVGIYLERGYFIHASSSKDQVTISNLYANYYKQHFKWGRRVTNISYSRR